MSNYPKIYSISTVGVRQHENADYLLHDVRTDFTGNNGLGKSLIADLLQLIFVPLRDDWKPGTEGLDEKERKIETIPLQREWISHAYSFLNIEKSKGKFLTIGVYIPRTSRVPVRPFIIQKSEDFENKKITLKTFEQILTSNDFIADNLHIYDLPELKRQLKKKHEIYLKDFYQRDQVNEYFELLFRNQILPIDLTKETNLKSFAKVLQSFAKAKTLKITDSKSLQNFLFEDDEDIKTTFDNQKEILNQHIRNFHRADQEIKTWEVKQKLLEHLKRTHATHVKAKEDFLSRNTHLLSKKSNEATKAFNENERTKDNAFQEYSSARTTYDTQCKESFALMLAQKEVCNEMRSRLEVEKSETGASNLKALKEQFQEKNIFNQRLELLSQIIAKLKTVEAAQVKFDEQEKTKEQRKRLFQLKGIDNYQQFQKSKWVNGYDSAYQYYNERNIFILEKLKTLKEVFALYDGNNPDSLFNWAIKEEKPLSIEQETVIMSFKEIFVRRLKSSEGKRFTVSPKSLMSSFEVEGEGVWVNLGEVSEYFPFVKKRMFNDKNKLHQAIEKDKEQITTEINSLNVEVSEINNLNKSLLAIGFNQELVEIYQDRERIEKYEVNKLLTEENVQFAVDNFESFANLKILKTEAKQLDEKITSIISKSSVVDSEIELNQEILDDILVDSGRLKNEITNPIDTTDLNLKSLSKKELAEKRKELKKEIKAAEGVRVATKKKRDDQLNTFNSAKAQAQALRQTSDSTADAFKKAKTNLEEQTELKFDKLLTMGNVTDESVENDRIDFINKNETYHTEYITVAGQFDESKPDKKNPELFNSSGIPYFSYQTLENVLCGRIGLSGLTKELNELNKTLLTLGDLQLKILTEVFGLVEKQYKAHDDTVRRLNFFFEKNKVSDAFQFKVEFKAREDINIDWIEKMKARGRVHNDGVDLFTLPEDLPSEENTPENLIRNIAKKFYGSVDADTSQLLNPKFYFTLKVKMEDEQGKKNAGSGGQAYTALALLCIGRLSIVQKHQERNPGIKFIIIEELSNIDDTNFNIFPEIAKQFGYQLMTMTPKPFGSYTNEEWYLHMLVKGKDDKERNYTPMSFFKTKYKKVELDKYLKEQNELEGTKAT